MEQRVSGCDCLRFARALLQNATLPAAPALLSPTSEYRIAVYAESLLGELSPIAVSPPFFVAYADAASAVHVTTALSLPSSSLVVTWTLTSDDRYFQSPLLAGVSGAMATVTCSWSGGLNAQTGVLLGGTLPTTWTAGTASTFSLSLLQFASLVPNTVSVSCVDAPLGRVVSAVSSPFTHALGTTPPTMTASAIVVEATTAVGPSLPAPAVAYRTAVEASVCASLVSPVTHATVPSFGFASEASVAGYNLTVRVTGVAADALFDVVSYAADMMLGGAVLQSARCSTPCSALSFSAAVAWSGLHRVQRAVCVSGTLAFRVNATNRAGATGSTLSLPFTLDATPPKALVPSLSALFCNADTATTSECDAVAALPTSASAVAVVLLGLDASFADPEADALVFQHRLVHADGATRDPPYDVFQPVVLESFAMYTLRPLEVCAPCD